MTWVLDHSVFPSFVVIVSAICDTSGPVGFVHGRVIDVQYSVTLPLLHICHLYIRVTGAGQDSKTSPDALYLKLLSLINDHRLIFSFARDVLVTYAIATHEKSVAFSVPKVSRFI